MAENTLTALSWSSPKTLTQLTEEEKKAKQNQNNTLAALDTGTTAGTYNDAFAQTNYGTGQPPQGQNNNTDVFGGLPNTLISSYMNTLQSMLNGSAQDSANLQASQATGRAIKQLRANAANANVGAAGQGAAIANKSATENTIAGLVSDQTLQSEADKQATKERGLTAVNTLAGLSQNQQQINNQNSQYYAGLQSQEKIAASQLASQEKIASSQLNLDQAKLTETARQFNISTEQANKQFYDTLKKNYAELSQQDKQFLASLGLDQAKFEEAKKQNAEANALAWAQLKSTEQVALKQIGVDEAKLVETARQFNISTEQANKQFYDTLKKNYAELSQQDKQFLASLGLDQAKFEEAKKQNAEANALAWAQLKSTEQVALKQIGVDEAKLAETARQFNISTEQTMQQFKDTLKKEYDAMSQQDKQFLASLGLDQAKFEEAKKQNAEANALAWAQLKSTEQVALKQIGVDEAKLAETARQFNISTEQTMQQFKDTLKKEYDAMSQQDKQFLASLGLDQAKFEESKKQWQEEFGLQTKISTADLDLREKELAQNASQFESKLAWEKSQFAQNLTEAEKNRIWEATQTDKSLAAQKEIALMQNNTELYKTQVQEKLTREGWTVEAAQKQADRDVQLTIANMEIALQREIEKGRITLEEKQMVQQASQFASQLEWEKSQFAQTLTEAERQRVWTTSENIRSEAARANENSLDRQLQREISNNNLSFQEKELAQQALQFKSQMDFNKSELAANLSEAEKDRIWKSAEAAQSRAHELQMQQIENAFAEKGYNFQMLMSALESLPEEQAADVLKSVAIDAGITHTVKDADGNPMKDEDGNYITVPGLEDYASYYKQKTGDFLKDWTPTQSMTADQANTLLKTYDTFAKENPDMFVQDQNIENVQLNDWTTDGSNRWILNSNAKEFVKNNTGKLYKASNGRLYVVVGVSESKDRKSKAAIVFKDVVSGTTVKICKTAGNGGSSFPAN
jgi:Arc/MetJ family transcription regulator